MDHGDGVSRPFFDPLTPSLRATKISGKFGFVELIQGFYHPWDKMACVGGTKAPNEEFGPPVEKKSLHGWYGKFVGRIKFANWGCKKKGNLNKVQGRAGLPFEEESSGKAT